MESYRPTVRIYTPADWFTLIDCDHHIWLAEIAVVNKPSRGLCEEILDDAKVTYWVSERKMSEKSASFNSVNKIVSYKNGKEKNKQELIQQCLTGWDQPTKIKPLLANRKSVLLSCRLSFDLLFITFWAVN